MKKLLLFVCIFALTAACSKDDSNDLPITNLELPSSSNPITGGSAVTIKGEGFTSASEIWFRLATRASSADVKAEITNVSSSEISFVAPRLTGEFSVILTQSGSEYILGKLTLKEAEGPGGPTSHIFATSFSTTSILYEFNQTDNSFIEYDRINDVYILGVASDKEGNIFYTGESGGLYSYNVPTKTQTTISSQWLDGFSTGDGVAIGMIDDKLHGVKFNSNTGYSLVSISNDGTETTVKTFGLTSDFDQYNSFSADNVFVYDEPNNVVLLSGYAAGQLNDEPAVLSLSIKTVNITTRIQNLTDQSGRFSLLSVDNDIWLFSVLSDWGTESTKTKISLIDPSTLEDNESVSEFNMEFTSPYYSAEENVILGIGLDDQDKTVLSIYDIASKATSPIDGNTQINQFFTVVK